MAGNNHQIRLERLFRVRGLVASATEVKKVSNSSTSTTASAVGVGKGNEHGKGDKWKLPRERIPKGSSELSLVGFKWDDDFAWTALLEEVGAKDVVTSVAFSPNGKLVAAV